MGPENATVDTGDAVDSLARPREINVAEPEWRRVAEEIRQRIREDRDLIVKPYKSEQRRWLHSYPQLQTLHETSYGTLRTALISLEAEGWITRVPGVGLMVREDHPA
jgi:DNA-binding GntR family transcriptional regulator